MSHRMGTVLWFGIPDSTGSRTWTIGFESARIISFTFRTSSLPPRRGNRSFRTHLPHSQPGGWDLEAWRLYSLTLNHFEYFNYYSFIGKYQSPTWPKQKQIFFFFFGQGYKIINQEATKRHCNHPFVCLIFSGARRSFILEFLWDCASYFNHSLLSGFIYPFDRSDGCPTVSNFLNSMNYGSHTLLGEPDWLSLSHVLTVIQ